MQDNSSSMHRHSTTQVHLLSMRKKGHLARCCRCRQQPTDGLQSPNMKKMDHLATSTHSMHVQCWVDRVPRNGSEQGTARLHSSCAHYKAAQWDSSEQHDSLHHRQRHPERGAACAHGTTRAGPRSKQDAQAAPRAGLLSLRHCELLLPLRPLHCQEGRGEVVQGASVPAGSGAALRPHGSSTWGLPSSCLPHHQCQPPLASSPASDVSSSRRQQPAPVPTCLQPPASPVTLDTENASQRPSGWLEDFGTENGSVVGVGVSSEGSGLS
ncbi:hypothetical protein AAFF_G00330360 [Aldrovandia affinis]|uniref:Uncharacterized protein n=1 Tax=Aldrovandia affinis TaxID=143900 RepID=A0AAD7SME0_9TELE|nr:hypothetical protein AAFF_G00330360 [Aldrovandia affinis]